LKRPSSARGLAKAVGIKTKAVTVETGVDLGGEFERGEGLAREPHGFYETPSECTDAVLYREIGVLRQWPTIWEPAAGKGAISRRLRLLGFSVYETDLIDRGIGAEIVSFYDAPRGPTAGLPIITNPPFEECSIKYASARWVKHAMQNLRPPYMALLLPSSWAASLGLGEFWEQFPPAYVYLLRWRVDFTGQKGGVTSFSWFVWRQDWTGPTEFRVLDRKDARQLEMFA
jgi:hypothetical protein